MAQSIAFPEHLFYPIARLLRFSTGIQAESPRGNRRRCEVHPPPRRRVVYDLPTDRDELRGESVSMEHLTGACRRVGMTSAAIESAAARVRAWRHCINYGKVLRRAA